MSDSEHIYTPLKKARGLGSSGHAIGHWIAERVSAIFLIPLMVFLLASIVAYAGADYPTMIAYLAHPVVTVLMIFFTLASLYHMSLGLGVIIEDYIGKPGSRVFLKLVVNFLAVLVGLVSVLALLRISFTS
ncbi:MAG: succinate dehydrogenase, hydrophobic membrane anchor protein [Alphaproteobacteria bacterium]